MKEQKTIILGVTGGIAAYKIADLASRLTKEGYDVHVIMTKNAQAFITPLTFETLTGNKCITDTFARNFEWDVKHVSLAKRADVLLIAPATANVLAKLAAGIADDMLTTTLLACTCSVVLSPSMNTAMYENPVTQRNLNTLKGLGYTVLDTEEGVLACKDIGKGRLPETEVLHAAIMEKLCVNKDYQGKKVLVTAGPTQEAIDPVRYLTNHSSGKMGYALASAAFERGAEVTLISGQTALKAPYGVKVIRTDSAADMFFEVRQLAAEADVIIKAAAVADFTPAVMAEDKLKKADFDEMCIPLVKTTDILSYLGEHKKPGQLLCGFSMETKDLVENSKKKLERKHADLIAANDLKQEGAGFQGDTNVITLISKDDVVSLPVMSKKLAAHAVLDRLAALQG